MVSHMTLCYTWHSCEVSHGIIVLIHATVPCFGGRQAVSDLRMV
jgi:hypothetical protein